MEWEHPWGQHSRTDVPHEEITTTLLSSYAHEWKPLGQQLVEIEKAKAPAAAPDGMMKIPAGDYVFKVQGIEIEGSNDVGVDVQYPWEDSARRFHERPMTSMRSISTSTLLEFLMHIPRIIPAFFAISGAWTHPEGWAKEARYVGLA